MNRSNVKSWKEKCLENKSKRKKEVEEDLYWNIWLKFVEVILKDVWSIIKLIFCFWSIININCSGKNIFLGILFNFLIVFKFFYKV